MNIGAVIDGDPGTGGSEQLCGCPPEPKDGASHQGDAPLQSDVDHTLHPIDRSSTVARTEMRQRHSSRSEATLPLHSVPSCHRSSLRDRSFSTSRNLLGLV